jgi:hypothetical protein
MKRLIIMPLIGTLGLTACEEYDLCEADDYQAGDITLPEPSKEITEQQLCELINEDVDCLEDLRDYDNVCGGLIWGSWTEGSFEGAYVTFETTDQGTASCDGRSMGWMSGEHRHYDNPDYSGGFFVGDWDDDEQELGGFVQGEYLPYPNLDKGDFHGAYDSINAEHVGDVWGLYKGQPHEEGAVFIGFFQDVEGKATKHTSVDDG